MTHKTALVSTECFSGEQTLYGEQTNWCSIRLDSAQWFAWLEAPEHCSFAYALMNHARGYIDGFMTVRKERRQRGTAYWTAYRRQGRHLRKVYLGPASALTAARLAEVARLLHTPDGPAP